MRSQARALILCALIPLSACATHPAPTERDPACYQAPETGMCRAFFKKYYFDGSQCQTFIWGGCGGQVPFETLEDCQAACEAPASAP